MDADEIRREDYPDTPDGEDQWWADACAAEPPDEEIFPDDDDIDIDEIED